MKKQNFITAVIFSALLTPMLHAAPDANVKAKHLVPYSTQNTAPPEIAMDSADILAAGLNPKLHTVTVQSLKKELRNKPSMAVGFDIDDTVLFSSPIFQRGKAKYSPHSDAYLSKSAFWDEANCGWDRFSIPKKVARDLIAMHQARGDRIYFITARHSAKCNFLTGFLQHTFSIKRMSPVIFTGTNKLVNTKIQPIRDKKIKIYYGDSDSDIMAARAAGAEGIRIMRAANSSYRPLPKNGRLGERIVANSQY